MNTKIMQCTCKREGQDQIHGKGNRVFNRTMKGKLPTKPVWRCTVCKREIEAGE